MSIKWTEKSKELGNKIFSINGRTPIVMRVRAHGIVETMNVTEQCILKLRRMHAAGLTRSMSKKGCSPDNAAYERFFGHLKNEMFYNRSWAGVSVKQFISILNDYILWYRDSASSSHWGLKPN